MDLLKNIQRVISQITGKRGVKPPLPLKGTSIANSQKVVDFPKPKIKKKFNPSKK